MVGAVAGVGVECCCQACVACMLHLAAEGTTGQVTAIWSFESKGFASTWAIYVLQ